MVRSSSLCPKDHVQSHNLMVSDKKNITTNHTFHKNRGKLVNRETE